MDEHLSGQTTSGGPELVGSRPLSKNAQKKLARATRIAEQKKERRAHEKEKKRERKRQLAEKRAAGEIEDDAQAGPRKKAKTEPRILFNARVVVDLGFDDLMNENEIKSLTSQLAFTYSANRKASRPFSSLLFTSLDKRTLARLESISDAAYKRWHDTEWWHKGYQQLWRDEESTDPTGTGLEGQSKEDQQTVCLDQAAEPDENVVQKASRESVVYLTADSSDELTELKEGETYIIGGICDHNRYKNLCLNKSEASQIRSARLPIGTYLAELKTRKVLTVNQTFEILLKWVETRDWKEAFEDVVPKRKFNEKGRRAKGGKDVHSDATVEDAKIVINAGALEEDDGDEAVENEDIEPKGP